ncbi:hypothetical protein D1627_05550 [Pontibacter oryzae]|uniref:Uncharacterized protein n=2 Tax=Pontibacter oryzae TaxID=2304593 RepID=A0A399SG32_9BACT|nr:hypothetical protein D1627_05550 [Pontibacter oryzae]
MESYEAGSSFESAIKVASVAEEYQWLRTHYPGGQMVEQSLLFHNKKPYDLLEIITEVGINKKVYFDISTFYGKH